MTLANERAAILEILQREDGAASAPERDRVDAYLRAKANLGGASLSAPLRQNVDIIRDKRGIPHISADDPYDLFFAQGVAQAQDRLWQLDFLRRQAHGRLSEIFGPEKLDEDKLYRTVGITGVSTAALASYNAESRDALHAYADGVNYWIQNLPAGLPIEFELLDYEPEPWQAVDSVAILRRWYWYSTGRLPVISTPEAVRAGIGDLEQAFFQPDGQTTYIVPAGNYEPEPRFPNLPAAQLREFFWGDMEGSGSNNWAIAPEISRTGNSMLGADPHNYYTVPTSWYDVHLHGADYEVIGMAYPGVPMVRFGRNQTLAWGITNNICMQRDLYVEHVNPDNANEYKNDGQWVPFTRHQTEIGIRDSGSVDFEIRLAHGRPVVDHLVPEAAWPVNLWPEDKGANTSLSLAWVGFEPFDGPQVLLDLGRAKNVAEGREALSAWRCPTWNFVLADSDGDIAYQCTGAIPLRGREHRGYRDASNPDDAWQGYVPYDGLPRLVNPSRGFVSSANNPAAPADFPYPLYGTWAVEDRAARVETLLQELKPHSIESFEAMQNDVFSGRASRGIPGATAVLENTGDDAWQEVIEILQNWDCRLTTDNTGGTIFYVFFWRWHQQVIRKRFAENLVPLVQDAGWGLSSALLHANEKNWFDSEAERETTIVTAMREAIAWLQERFGDDPIQWSWGALHRLGATHPAASTPLQHELFDIAPEAQPGGAGTLSSGFYTPAGTFDTKVGPSYRIISSLAQGATTMTVTWPGHSGQAGSSHYRDQVDMHKHGHYDQFPFNWAEVEEGAESRQQISREE